MPIVVGSSFIWTSVLSTPPARGFRSDPSEGFALGFLSLGLPVGVPFLTPLGLLGLRRPAAALSRAARLARMEDRSRSKTDLALI